MKKVFVSGTITPKNQGFHNRTQNKDKKPQIGAYQRLSLVRASEASVGDTKGRPLRVGLLQQDARPDSSHRLRPQGLSRTAKQTELPKRFAFRGVFVIGMFSVKVVVWYERPRVV